MGDNQWSCGVVIAGFCSFGALDHQHRVFYQSSLPYLSEDRDSTSHQVLLISPTGEQLKYVFHILFEVLNNKAEYEALLHRLRLTVSLGIKRLHVYGDSLLVVQQVNKEWDINKDTMDAYVSEIRKLKNMFSRLEIHHLNRNNNVGAVPIELMSHK
jgi:hypothetical protein